MSPDWRVSGGGYLFFSKEWEKLVDALKVRVDLDYPLKAGSKRSQLLHVVESTEIEPVELNEPEVPEMYLNVWIYFWELKMAGNLSYTEILNYMLVTAEKISPVTVRLIIKLNAEYETEVIRIQRGLTHGS
jgi:hypothetical protein